MIFPQQKIALDNRAAETDDVPSAHSSSLVALRQTLTTAPVVAAITVLAIVVLIAILAPVLWTGDPVAIDPIARLKRESSEYWMGTDAFGRDVYSRVMYGARISLLVGLGASCASVALGLLIGIIAGYFRSLDSVIMRIMDGIMAIPSILLAIALVTISGGSLATVIFAITLPDIFGCVTPDRC